MQETDDLPEEVNELVGVGRWFSAGLRNVGEQLQKPVTAKTLMAYFGLIAEETNPDEWTEFCRIGAKLFGWGPWLPLAPDMLNDLRRFRGEPSKESMALQLSAEAVHAYERVMASGVYTAEGGTTWNYRRVVETCGRAAGEAFMAAGGPEAFRVTNEQWNHDKRRNAFVAAYQLATREEPTSRLLPPGPEPKQIAAGEQQDPRLTREEAKGFLEKLREHGADIPAPPPERKDFDVRDTPERRAFLKAQAERIAIDEGAQAS